MGPCHVEPVLRARRVACAAVLAVVLGARLVERPNVGADVPEPPGPVEATVTTVAVPSSMAPASTVAPAPSTSMRSTPPTSPSPAPSTTAPTATSTSAPRQGAPGHRRRPAPTTRRAELRAVTGRLAGGGVVLGALGLALLTAGRRRRALAVAPELTTTGRMRPS